MASCGQLVGCNSVRLRERLLWRGEAALFEQSVGCPLLLANNGRPDTRNLSPLGQRKSSGPAAGAMQTSAQTQTESQLVR